MQYVAPYPANVITSDVTGQFASVTALNATGLYLYNLVTGLTGQSDSAGLALTGALLSSRIDSLSGYVLSTNSGLSGFLQNQISNTGTVLNNKTDSLSGYSNATFATQSRIDLTGQALSQNLYLTGSNLYFLVTGSSGYAAIVYATKANLEQTGSNLQFQINGLQNAQFITTGSADQRYVNLTGSQLISGSKTFRSAIRVNNIINDGLIINIDGISGTYAGYGGAGPEINLFSASLKDLLGQTTLDWSQKTLSGNWSTDGIIVNGYSIINWSQLVNVSGAISSVIAETGSILNQKINLLSGYANTTFSTITRVANTGQQAWDAANNNGINLSGNLSNTGAALIARDLVISGGLEARLTLTGFTAITHANSIGSIISGNLTQTGITLFARDTAISGGLEARISVTGNLINARIDSLSGYLDRAITKSITISSTYTITTNDPQIIYCNFSNPTALVFPTASTVSGRMWNIKSINTGAIYLSGSTFDGQSVYNMSIPYMSQVVHAQAGGYYLID
jgi:hypothetical protein